MVHRSAAPLVLLSVAVVAGEGLPKTDRIPAAPTAQQEVLIAEGIALYDAGQHDSAVAKYKQVLEESPDQVHALYELAFTYLTKKDLESALALAHRGVQYRSELLPRFCILLGNALDDLGKRAEAIEVYRDGIKQAPMTALLHFNLGLALMRSGKHPEAKKALQQSVSLDPNHASSHYLLASVYLQLGYPVPAILALSRLLLIEPVSPKGKEALAILYELVRGSATRGERPNEIRITPARTPDSRKDEGDFDVVALALSMGIGAALIEDLPQASEFKRVAIICGVMAEPMSAMKKKGFAAKYYAPFFAEMAKRGFVKAFIYRAFQAAQLAGSAEWGKENDGKLREFEAWFRGYRWPSAK